MTAKKKKQKKAKAVVYAATALPLAVAVAASFLPGMKSSSAAKHTSHAKGAACYSPLPNCHDVGCAEDGTPAGQTNARKRRRIDSGTPIVLTLADLVGIQPLAEKKVGTPHGPLTDVKRKKLSGFKVHGLSVADGDLVAVAGYIVADPPPHPNTGESVNCNLSGKSNNDFHITITDEAGSSPFEGIVVEMIPQDRPASWTTSALTKLANAGVQVLAVGQLFYDSQHDVNGDPGHSTGDPPRSSLFEVHPISKFLVCTSGKTCNPKKESDWTPLEDYAP